MALVERLYAQTAAAESPALTRIRRLSLPFEIAFGLFAALSALLFLAVVAVGLFYTGEQFRLTTHGPTLYLGRDAFAPGSIKISDVPLLSRVIGCGVMFVIQGGLIAAFYSLHR